MEPFKNLISEEIVVLCAVHLGKHLPEFDELAFTKSILLTLSQLELKQRVKLISGKMLAVLPDDVVQRNAILVGMLHPDKDNHSVAPSSDEGMCGWGVWPLTDVIGQSGLEDFDGSMSALREITMRGTSEFDVRPFIDADPDRALKIVLGWAHDENEHVRRLASEGSRPRLPWGMRLKAIMADPSRTLPILEALRDDPSEYVRRSVANHLNDIAKDHPGVVADIAEKWMQGATKNRERLVRHACRSLVKQGHEKTLAVFGVLPPEIMEPEISVVTKNVTLGEKLTFEVALSSSGTDPQKLLIDYVIHHRKANGSLSPKVFKWKRLELASDETVELRRDHAIRPITTRKYYAGQHFLSLRINGHDFGNSAFDLQLTDFDGAST